GTSMMYHVIGSDIEGCEDDDSVMVTVFEIPISNAGFDQELCDTGSTDLMGNTPVAESGIGTWTSISGPTVPVIDDLNDPGTLVTGLLEGVYEFVWTVGNVTCTPVADTMTVTIYDQPISFAGL